METKMTLPSANKWTHTPTVLLHLAFGTVCL